MRTAVCGGFLNRWMGGRKDSVRNIIKNGQLMREGTYKDDQLDGEVTSYYLSGQLLSKVHYDHGVLNEDDWREYYESGALHNEVRVHNGKQEGEVKEFYPDGHIKTEGLYKDGQREGIFNIYRVEGWLWYKEFFVRDHLVKRREYDAQGHLVMEQVFYK